MGSENTTCIGGQGPTNCNYVGCDDWDCPRKFIFPERIAKTTEQKMEELYQKMEELSNQPIPMKQIQAVAHPGDTVFIQVDTDDYEEISRISSRLNDLQYTLGIYFIVLGNKVSVANIKEKEDGS